MMAIEKHIVPPNEQEGKRIVYLKEREGGIHTKEFDTRRQCRKYLGRHHDSVVAYEEYLVTEDGSETFWTKGSFTPRTKAEKQKNRARRRRKCRARQRAREKERMERQSLRPTKW